MLRLFYESADGNAKIYHGDVTEHASLGIAGMIDLILADPPFNEISHDWDRWPKGWPKALLPVLKQHGSMWCCGSFKMFWRFKEEFCPTAEDKRGWNLAQEVIWKKQTGTNMMNDRFRRVHEMVVHFWPKGIEWGQLYREVQYTPTARKVKSKRAHKPAHWHGIGESSYETERGGPVLVKSVLTETDMMDSIISARNMMGRRFKGRNGEGNDTQKPFDLLEPLLKYSAPPGGTVLVPFAGSGSEMALALQLGYRVIAFDVREDQCQLAKERITGGTLFDASAAWSYSKEEILSEIKEQKIPSLISAESIDMEVVAEEVDDVSPLDFPEEVEETSCDDEESETPDHSVPTEPAALSEPEGESTIKPGGTEQFSLFG